MGWRREESGILRREGDVRGGEFGGLIIPPLLKLSNGIFVRASDAWWVNDAGAIVQEVGSGVLRNPLPNRYGMEGAVTNQSFRSEEWATAPWTPAGTVPTITADQYTSPQGDLSADDVTFGNSSNSRVQQVQALARWPLSAQMVLSCFHRDITGSGFTVTHRADLIDGSSTTDPMVTADAWARHAFDVTQPGAGASTLRHRFQNAPGSVWSASLWGAMSQHDAPYIRTSYVQTLGATATKAADDLSFPNASIPTELLTNGFWFQLWPYHTNTQHVSYTGAQTLLDLHTGSNALLEFSSAANTLRIVNDPTAAAVTGPAMTWAERDVITVAVDFDSDELRYQSASEGTPHTADISTIGWGAAVEDLQIAALEGLSNPYWGDISDIHPLISAPI